MEEKNEEKGMEGNMEDENEKKEEPEVYFTDNELNYFQQVVSTISLFYILNMKYLHLHLKGRT